MGEASAASSPGVAGLLGRYFAVVAAAASALLVLDAVPWIVTGVVRGVVAHRSVEVAERALGAKLLLPAYVPPSYRWPPAAVRTCARPVRAAALTIEPRDDTAGPLVLVQSLDGDTLLPETLLPGGKEIHRVAFDLDGTPAMMTDVLLPPDGTARDISFLADGRRVVFRFRGDPAEILRMAASVPGRERR